MKIWTNNRSNNVHTQRTPHWGVSLPLPPWPGQLPGQRERSYENCRKIKHLQVWQNFVKISSKNTDLGKLVANFGSVCARKEEEEEEATKEEEEEEASLFQ